MEQKNIIDAILSGKVSIPMVESILSMTVEFIIPGIFTPYTTTSIMFNIRVIMASTSAVPTFSPFHLNVSPVLS